MTDHAAMVTAIARVRFQRSARYPAGIVTIPLTRMKAENNTPMAVSPTPKAALIWLLLPRTMYWSIPSTNRVNPTTHMGHVVTTMRRGNFPSVMTRRTAPGQAPGVYPAGRAIDFISRKLSRPSGPNSRPTPDSLKPPKGVEKSIGTGAFNM